VFTETGAYFMFVGLNFSPSPTVCAMFVGLNFSMGPTVCAKLLGQKMLTTSHNKHTASPCLLSLSLIVIILPAAGWCCA
jgi:hypothetical protein